MQQHMYGQAEDICCAVKIKTYRSVLGSLLILYDYDCFHIIYIVSNVFEK